MKNYDVIIIGSGISGLTSAILLAKENLKVAVFEKHSKAGGYMHSFQRFGTVFETGGHYVGAMSPGKPFWALLNHLGVYTDDLFIPLASDGYDHLYFPSGTFKFQREYSANIEYFCEAFPNEKDKITEYFNLVKSVSKIFPTTYYNTQFDSQALAKWLSISLADVFNNLALSPLLQSVLSAYCCLHGVKPTEVAFGPHAVITDTLITGAYAFRSSGDALVKNYLQRCHDLGVDIYLNEEVKKLETTDHLIHEVITSKQVVKSKWIISSQHPKNAFELVSENTSSMPYKMRLDSMIESDGIFAIYANLNEKPKFNPYSNYYYFGSDVLSEVYNIRPLDVQIAYLCRPGKAHEQESLTLSPHLTIHVPCLFSEFESWKNSVFGKRPIEYNNYKEEYFNSTLLFLEKFNLKLKPQITNYVTSSPLTNIHFNGSRQGTSYGLYHSIKQTGLYGLQPRTKIKNLLLTGQNISFPGLQSSASSALRTCGHILGTKSILNELKKWIQVEGGAQ